MVENTIDDQKGRLTRLIQYTSGEPKNLIKHLIQHASGDGYDQAIKILDEEYGDVHTVTNSYLKELRQWPAIRSNDTQSFKNFHQFLVKCQAYKEGSRLLELDSADLIRTLVLKLHTSYHERWNRLASKVRLKKERAAKFEDFVKFVEDEKKLLCNPMYSKEALAECQATKVKSNHTQIEKKELDVEGPKEPCSNTCSNCNSKHDIENCKEYLDLGVDDRHKLIFSKKLCFCCLQPVSEQHVAKLCTQKRRCKVCNDMHPTTLHGDKSFVAHAVTTDIAIVSMCIVMVELWQEKQAKRLRVYALLDECCQGTIIREDIIDELDITATQYEPVSIGTVVGEDWMPTPYFENLVVKGVSPFTDHYQSVEIKLPRTYARPMLAMAKEDVATPSNIKSWDYLDSIKDMIPEYDPSVPFGLMIGGNCPTANESFEQIHSQRNGPYAKRTPLGWCIIGPISSEERVKSINSNYTRMVAPKRDVATNQVPSHYFHFQSHVSGKEISHKLNDMYVQEFNEVHSEKKAPSREDEHFLKTMENGKSRAGTHYMLPLPFRNPDVEFPNNRDAVVQRLRPLKRRFQLNPTVHLEYSKSMEKLISQGHARIADKRNDQKGKVWFIPHHPVFNEKKDKIRVVFDCNSKYNGHSLNDELVQGPDLANSLAGVLMRFREEDIAFMGDIEAMYLQVKVPVEQRSFLRFLWWPGGNLDVDPVEYEMCAHLFGATSSGGCANYALKQAGKDGKDKFGVEAANALNENFYVDDLLKSVRSVDAAKSLISNVIGMCDEGGFNLTKIVSNNAEVVNSLPVDKRALSVRECDLSQAPIERALGAHWHIENDTFKFSITFKDLNQPRTRSSLVSTITSIYDPLGLAAPFLLKGRKVTQAVSKLKGSWEDSVPQELMTKWEEWRSQLLGLLNLEVNRCYKPKGFVPVSVSLHCFSDASRVGYGQGTYIRYINAEGEIWVSLVMGKSRVTPSKPSTMPRSELVAAKTSVLVGTMAEEELTYDNLDVTYWVDSMIVLGYIFNDTKRFSKFVANRTKKIRDYTEKKQWKYVDTSSNPADHASRGIAAADTEKVNRWLNGPEFLWQPEDTWVIPEVEEIPDDDPELLTKKTIICNATRMKGDREGSLLCTLEKFYSCWHYILIVVATMMKFIARCRKKHVVTGMMTVKEMEGAKVAILKMIQAESFGSVSTQIHPKGRLASLDPFVDKDGILRVGGRLTMSPNEWSTRHPIILPRKSTAVKLLVRWHHQLVEHEGRTATLHELRDNGFWVIGANNLIRNMIHKCVDCRSKRGKVEQQKMANLPEERSVSEGPFVHCGLDMFGHYIIKEGRKELKRWGILFTCLSCRGIHLETVSNADTDSFILALRRFIARRGVVRSIRSDNGGNFIGASNELEKAYKEMNHDKIRKYLLTKQCDMILWQRNPPESSHKGGVWERQIRSAKNVLNTILRKHDARLNDESFRTFLTEVESIVNSRPLTVDTLGDNTMLAISPQNLLTMKSKVVLQPPGDFQPADIYCQRRWRTVQFLANVFWSRWRKEFLSSLQARQKWTKPTRNMEVGDVVLVKDSKTSRNQWPMGRITAVYPGEDGLVRTVQVKTSASREPLMRSVAKIVLLLENNEPSS